jgi:hypothetical protein
MKGNRIIGADRCRSFLIFIRYESSFCNGASSIHFKKPHRGREHTPATRSIGQTVPPYGLLPGPWSGSTSSQLGPAAISTLRGTFKSSALVMTCPTSSASRGSSASGASNTSSS